MEPVQTFDRERVMAAIERCCGRGRLASASKRLSERQLVARRHRAISIAIAASIGVAACILVAGCSGHDERTTPAAAAETAPMLPGTRGARPLDTEAPAGAQRFDTASPALEPERDAQGPLLPPVMHSAD
jgi:hypothetical protein